MEAEASSHAAGPQLRVRATTPSDMVRGAGNHTIKDVAAFSNETPERISIPPTLGLLAVSN